LPADIAAEAEIVLRADSAGATHDLLDWAREGGICFSVGFDLTEPVREAIARIPDQRWVSAVNQDGSERDNGKIAEATDLIDLCGWPQGSRLIVRRERPHPGAQLSFIDADGHRFQAILTDREGEAADLEREHRARARCEDRIRCAKAIGLELLLALTDTLLLRGELSGLEPKRLRYRALHIAGRLAFHARRATLRLERRWPWAEELAAAFTRLRELPVPAG
jgi:Transposase DDE domain group 1